jgi:hypothetical protein
VINGQFVLIRLASINTLCSSMIACQVRWLLVFFFFIVWGGLVDFLRILRS